MAHHVAFDRILDRLYKRRTDRLRRILNPKTGKVRTLTKRHREKTMHRLEEIVSLGLAEKMPDRSAFGMAELEVHLANCGYLASAELLFWCTLGAL